MLPRVTQTLLGHHPAIARCTVRQCRSLARVTVSWMMTDSTYWQTERNWARPRVKDALWSRLFEAA